MMLYILWRSNQIDINTRWERVSSKCYVVHGACSCMAVYVMLICHFTYFILWYIPSILVNKFTYCTFHAICFQTVESGVCMLVLLFSLRQLWKCGMWTQNSPFCNGSSRRAILQSKFVLLRRLVMLKFYLYFYWLKVMLYSHFAAKLFIEIVLFCNRFTNLNV